MGTFRITPICAHFNPDSLEKIFHLKMLHRLQERGYQLIQKNKEWFFHISNDKNMKFKECRDGLYLFYTTKKTDTNSIPITNYYVSHHRLLNTVANNKHICNLQEIEGEDRARKLQQQMGWPGLANLKSYIANNLIRNCAITIDNTIRAWHIYGRNVPILKGKMTKQSNPEIHATTIPLTLHTDKQQKGIKM